MIPFTSMPEIVGVYAALQHGGGFKDALGNERLVAAQLNQMIPGLPDAYRESRAAMERMVAHVAQHHQIQQWLNIGVGMPASPGDDFADLLDLVRALQPDSLHLLVDNADRPVVHSRALLEGDGITAFKGDLRELEKILTRTQLYFDLSKPVAVILGLILHFLTDDEAVKVIPTLRRYLAPGSVVLATCATSDTVTGEELKKGVPFYRENVANVVMRSGWEIAALFEGCQVYELDGLEPGERRVADPPGLPLTIDMLPTHSTRMAKRAKPHFRAAIAALHGE